MVSSTWVVRVGDKFYSAGREPVPAITKATIFTEEAEAKMTAAKVGGEVEFLAGCMDEVTRDILNRMYMPNRGST